ncbi:MAG: Swt1 family HEPN domain-containing protein, partial [Candidatus Methanofastidiosia archaeon]
MRKTPLLIFIFLLGTASSQSNLFWENKYPAKIDTNLIEISDLEDDGKKEIFVVTEEGILHTLNYQLRLLWQYPTSGTLGKVSRILVDDLDFDSKKEVVIATFDGRVHVVSSLGRFRNKYDLGGVLSALLSVDLDKKSPKEILVARKNKVYLLKNGGAEEFFSLPVEGEIKILEASDLDRDGNMEILVGISSYLYIVSFSGIYSEPFDAGKDIQSIHIEDLNNDKLEEVVILTIRDQIHAIDFAGNLLWTTQIPEPIMFFSLTEEEDNNMFVGTHNGKLYLGHSNLSFWNQEIDSPVLSVFEYNLLNYQNELFNYTLDEILAISQNGDLYVFTNKKALILRYHFTDVSIEKVYVAYLDEEDTQNFGDVLILSNEGFLYLLRIDRDFFEIANTYYDFGMQNFQEKKYEEAKYIFEFARSRYESWGVMDMVSNCLENIELADLYLEKLSRAKSLEEDGDLKLELQRWNDAKESYEKAKEIFAELELKTEVSDIEKKISLCEARIAEIQRNQSILISLGAFILTIVLFRRGRLINDFRKIISFRPSLPMFLKKRRHYPENSMKKLEIMSLSESMDGFEILFNLENNLRIFMEERLQEAYGDRWWRKGVHYNVYANWQAKKKAEVNNPWCDTRDLPMLMYSNFTQLAMIIESNKNWDIFRPYFKDKSSILGKLKELEPIRNKIAHNRPL